MIKIKPITLLLGGILAAGTILSADARPYRYCGGWYVEIEGFHVKANDTLLSNVAFAETDITDDDDDFEEVRSHHIDPDFAWGYRLAIGYDNPSCCCDYTGFSIEYTNWNHEDHDRVIDSSFDGEEGITFIPISFFDEDDFTDATARFDVEYQTLDLLGHKHKVCPCYVDVDFFVGARFVNLEEKYHAHFFLNDDFIEDNLITEIPEDFIHIKNDFEGVGPRVGVNAFYCIGGGFGVAGELAASLIFGETDSHYEEIFTLEDTDTADADEHFEFHEDHHEKAHVVPGLSGKVALAYRGQILNCYKVDIELGWRGDKYFDIAHHSALVQAASDEFERNFDKHAHYHDFELEGPYASISFHG